MPPSKKKIKWEKWLVKKWYKDYNNEEKPIYNLDEIWVNVDEQYSLSSCIEKVKTLHKIEI